jgi:hypothetical protein
MTTPHYTDTSEPFTTTVGEDSPGMSEQAKQTAGAAAEETRHVASVAQDEAKNVASEATNQARSLVGQATTQVEEQSREQARRLAGTVRTFGDDLQSMAASSEGGMAADLARQVADRARSLSSQLETREPRDLLDDVRAYARRKPGTFLLGALAAGVVAGRLARGAKEAQSDGQGSSTSMGNAENLSGGTLTTTPGPTAGTRPSSGAVPTGYEEAPGTGTGTGAPLAGAHRSDPLTSTDRPLPTEPSAPGGRA